MKGIISKYERYVGGYRWDIFIWELVGGVGYEQTGFTNSSIAHDNTLGEERLKHRKNCECCPVSQLIVR